MRRSRPRKKDKLPAPALARIPFPKCSANCAFIEHMGCGECENACPFKFRRISDDKEENLTQAELDAWHRQEGTPCSTH